MSGGHFEDGCFNAETWSNDPSQSVTPEPEQFNYGINPEASLWEHGNFDASATLPAFHFDTNQQHITARNVQPYIQPFNVLPRGGSPMLNARSSALHHSFSLVPNSSSLKRHYSSISPPPYQQEATHVSPHGMSLHFSQGQPQFSQYNHRHPPLKKRRRFAQTASSGVRQNVLSRDEEPEVIIRMDHKGQAHGQFRTFGAREKVRRDLTASEIARTNRTRKLAACGRCKALKQRCDRPACGLMPCGNCLHARNSATAKPEHGLCIRVDIHSLSLHRNGTTGTTILKEWLSRKEILACSSFLLPVTHRRSIQLSQGIDGIILEVPVAQYATESEDKTWYNWKDSNHNVRQMNMPAWYICDMQSTKETLVQNFGSGSTGKYVLSLLRDEGNVIKQAFREAYRLSQNSSLLRNSLNIWCGTRLTELTWTICGNDKVGISPPTESENPWKGTVPVTPVMDTQLDEIAINSLLKPYAVQYLQELHSKMTDHDTTHWYEVLLSLIIILHNFQRMSKDIKEYATRHGMEKTSFPGRPSLSQRNIHACKSLLAYFHFAYLGSRRFFSIMKKGKEMETMSREQQKFLQLLHCFMSKKDQLKDWHQRDMYTDSMFWVIQLLVYDWKADLKDSTPIEDFTEDDLLTT